MCAPLSRVRSMTRPARDNQQTVSSRKKIEGSCSHSSWPALICVRWRRLGRVYQIVPGSNQGFPCARGDWTVSVGSVLPIYSPHVVAERHCLLHVVSRDDHKTTICTLQSVYSAYTREELRETLETASSLMAWVISNRKGLRQMKKRPAKGDVHPEG